MKGDKAIGFPFARPLYVMAKPVGATCNLHCDYCYYLEKNERLRSATPRWQMTEELLERFIKSYIEAQTMPEVLFTWHGGEPTLRPLSFYQKAIELQKKYARGRRVTNSLQTNGTRLSDEWCRFFKEHDFLIGISVDGPAEYHDAYRKGSGGKATHADVMRGVELLKKHDVAYNALAVVNHLNVQDPVGFYHFFKEIECYYIQFTPVVERYIKGSSTPLLAHQATTEETVLAPFSITAKEWGEFLCQLFDEWVQRDVGRYFVQLFDTTLANWVGAAPGLCTMAKQCGHAAAIEHNGDLYSCDHFVFPEYRLGNLRERSIYEMMNSPEQLAFGQNKYKKLPQQCRECEYLFACWGECPRNRFISDEYGSPGLNYLCEGYYRFFHHVAPYMDFMADELKAGRPPANVMAYALKMIQTDYPTDNSGFIV